MSADNVDHCPRCVDKRNAEMSKLLTDVGAKYGKVSVEDFDTARADYDRRSIEVLEKTFREDYHVNLERGTVYVEYKGNCKACGLSTRFEYEHEFYKPES